MKQFQIKTSRKRQVIDITGQVEKMLPAGEGVAVVFVKHTTAAVATADLDPGTDLDMLDAFEAMMPKLEYRHPHDPSHVTDHIISTLIGASVQVPYVDGKFSLGTWQRIVLFEFDGPRPREVTLSFLSAK